MSEDFKEREYIYGKITLALIVGVAGRLMENPHDSLSSRQMFLCYWSCEAPSGISVPPSQSTWLLYILLVFRLLRILNRSRSRTRRKG